MTKKKKVIRNFGRENGHFFPEKIVISEIFVRENFFRSPQTLRQVSAAELINGKMSGVKIAKGGNENVRGGEVSG